MFGYILSLKNFWLICIPLFLMQFLGNDVIAVLAYISLWLCIIYFAIPVIRIESCNKKIREILAKELMDNELINNIPLQKILVDSLPKMISNFKPPSILFYLNNKCPYCRGIHHRCFVKYVYGRNTAENWSVTSIDTLATSCLNKEKHSTDPWDEVLEFNVSEWKKDIVRELMRDEGKFN